MQLIESVGLKAEEHRVETDDGYILTLHRYLFYFFLALVHLFRNRTCIFVKNFTIKMQSGHSLLVTA